MWLNEVALLDVVDIAGGYALSDIVPINYFLSLSGDSHTLEHLTRISEDVCPTCKDVLRNDICQFRACDMVSHPLFQGIWSPWLAFESCLHCTSSRAGTSLAW